MTTPAEIWTIGHSYRSFEDFLELLRTHHIENVADVRRFPVSRRFPHFSQLELFKRLNRAGIGYNPLPELGGRRRPLPGSTNTAWQNDSFRGFADYMTTSGFLKGVAQLTDMAAEQRTAIMCAEAVWWRCHRALIADHLKAQGIKVLHILSSTKVQEHPFSSPARFVDGQLRYVAEPELELVH